MSLTEQQERFCRAILEGKNQGDAYREAGYKCANDETAWACSSRLLSNAKVSQRIAELRAAAAQEAQIDLAWLVRECAATYAAAKKDAAYGPAVSALKELGILTGERVEKSVRENINRNVDEFDEAALLAIASGSSAGASRPQGVAPKPDPLH